jgi:hypothetical protein
MESHVIIFIIFIIFIIIIIGYNSGARAFWTGQISDLLDAEEGLSLKSPVADAAVFQWGNPGQDSTSRQREPRE